MKFSALALAVSLAVLFTAGEGRATSGQELNEFCSYEDASFGEGVCFGYVDGVYDAGREVPGLGTNRLEWPGLWTACVPKAVTLGQLVEVVKKWLREHPEDWHYGADGQVARAFSETWPCP
jgi:hypothetical protein